ncbi:MAG: tetratricopeptide repeat protein [Verrucomicrobiales bacterium]
MASGQAKLAHILADRAQKMRAEGNAGEALRLAETALETARKAAADPRGSTSALPECLGICADLHAERGELAAAEKLYIEAMSQAEVDCAEPLAIADLKCRLAALYDFGGLEEKAIPIYAEAIALFEAMPEPPDLDLANLRNNLAMLHKNAGDYNLAEEEYLSALEGFRRAYGGDSEDAAAVLNNLGGLYHAAGYAERAEDMHRRALEMRRAILPAEHPEVGQALSNLAAIHHEMNRYAEAKKHYREALGILEKHAAADPETYAIVSENYATLLREHGHDWKAKSVEKKAVKLGAAALL